MPVATVRAHLASRIVVLGATAVLCACSPATPSSPGTQTTTGPATTSPAPSTEKPVTPGSRSPGPTPIVPSPPITLPSGTTSAGPTPTPTSITPTSITPTSTTPPSITLSGTVIEGLRPSCRVLQTAKARYVLTGAGSQTLRTGDRVTVEGAARRELITPCGGLTFVVTRTLSHS